MRNLVIMIGIPGSGKSTYIDENLDEYQIVCRDDIRLSLGTIFEPLLEKFVYAIADTMVRANMIRQRNIVIDETNTNIKTIENYLLLARTFDYTTTAILFKTPLEICKQRRDFSLVPEAVIDRMYLQLNKLLEENDLNLLFNKVMEVK